MAFYNGKKIISHGRLDLGSPVYEFAKSEQEKGANEFDASLLNETNKVMYFPNIDSIVIPSQNIVGSNLTLKELCPNMVVGEKYYLSFEPTISGEEYIRLGLENYWNNKTSKAITQEDLDSEVYFFGKTNTTRGLRYFMINKGEEAQPYYPYNGAIVRTKDLEKFANNEDLANYQPKGTIDVTDTTPTNGAVIYFPLYTSDRSAGQTARANRRFYYYDSGTWASFNLGYLNNMGILSIHHGTTTADKYANIQPAGVFTANRTLKIQDADGTIALLENVSKLKYRHSINIVSSIYRIWVEVICDRSTAFTVVEFSKWLYANGYTAVNNLASADWLACGGGSRSTYQPNIHAIACNGNNGSNVFSIVVVGENGTNAATANVTDLYDKVTKII